MRRSLRCFRKEGFRVWGYSFVKGVSMCSMRPFQGFGMGFYGLFIGCSMCFSGCFCTSSRPWMITYRFLAPYFQSRTLQYETHAFKQLGPLPSSG